MLSGGNLGFAIMSFLHTHRCTHKDASEIRDHSLIMTWVGSANYRGVIMFWSISVGGHFLGISVGWGSFFRVLIF